MSLVDGYTCTVKHSFWQRLASSSGGADVSVNDFVLFYEEMQNWALKISRMVPNYLKTILPVFPGTESLIPDLHSELLSGCG